MINRNILVFVYCISVIILFACTEIKKQEKSSIPDNQEQKSKPKKIKEIADTLETKINNKVDFDTSRWAEIKASEFIRLDLRYATSNNFTKTKIYDCPRCFFHPLFVKKIDKVFNEILEQKGYGVIIYDCYRPAPAQNKLWDLFPNEIYVTNPKKGSMHNRGVAIDFGLLDKNGNVIDMGTDFDHFGREAHFSYTGFDEEIISNRRFLREIMTRHGFNSITSEWWHYSLNGTGAQLSNWQWNCH